jgi:hypothetical protein
MRKIKRPTLIYSWLACIQVRRRRFTLTYRGDRRCSVVAHAGLLGGEADGSVLNAMPGDGGELLRKGETTIVVHGDWTFGINVGRDVVRWLDECV